MLESSARRPLARLLPTTIPALLALVVMTTTGCAGEEKKAAPPPAPTPMTSLNTTAMQVPRIEFCQLVPDAAVRRALGQSPDSDSAYGNGDEQELASVGTVVVHEIGCAWSTDDGASARAWVFARPVDAAFARTVVASARLEEGCRTTRGPAYGDPSLTQTCREPDGSQRIRHAGLFGQTWLTCEVTATDPEAVADLDSRSERWCVDVVNALNTGR